MRLKRFTYTLLNYCGPIGQKMLCYLEGKNDLFRSASEDSFRYLDKKRGPKTIDRVYEKAMNEIFILLKSLHMSGDVFEFGVFKGFSSRWLAQKIQQFQLHDARLHLFDSFEGLPEGKGVDLAGYEYVLQYWPKGAMAVKKGTEHYIQKHLRTILSNSRVFVTKGFFEETLDNYFSQKPGLKARLIHFDCDLYSSSKYVFEFLLQKEVIQDGTLLIFDDWMTSRGNPNLGQRRAVEEVLQAYPHWSIEKYFNYGVGSHVFVAHDLRVASSASAR